MGRGEKLAEAAGIDHGWRALVGPLLVDRLSSSSQSFTARAYSLTACVPARILLYGEGVDVNGLL
jgi:hypothetical protein